MTLNRPSALNAITLAMAVTMTEYMQAWADDPAVGAILLDGAGARGFCAGGDIRALYDAAKAGDTASAASFFRRKHERTIYRFKCVSGFSGTGRD